MKSLSSHDVLVGIKRGGGKHDACRHLIYESDSVVALSLEQVADLREQLDVLGNCGSFLGLFLLAASVQSVHRHDHEEVQCKGNDQEVDQCSDDGAGLNSCRANGELQEAVEVRLADQTTDEGVEELLNQSGDDCGK